jgi:phosphatidylserine decarboxylase
VNKMHRRDFLTATVAAAAGGLLAPMAASTSTTLAVPAGKTSTMQPVVEKLKALIEEHGWHEMFEEAIKNVQRANVPRLKNIGNLDDYLLYINSLLEWVPTETESGREIYSRLCEFYFILDQPPIKDLQNKITPADQSPPLTPLSEWMVEYANAWGEFLDTPESLTEESLRSYYESPAFKMHEYMPDPGGWKTFNQLFARRVKPGMRPIAALDDDTVIVSAADSTFVGWWQISEESKITVKNLQWSVLELLEGSPYRDRFKGGIFMHSFLNTTDYHRLHVPVGGTVLESRVIHGQVYLDVHAVPVAGTDESRVEAVREFEAEDATGYQFAQARGVIVLDSPIGLVAVLPIGMAQVSSVVMTAEVGKKLHKGEEFAYFQFGGSDHVMLFEAASNVNLTAQPNVHYNQGACIGQAYP